MSNAQTREEAREAILTALAAFGYSRECVRLEWPLPDPGAVRSYQGSGNQWRDRRPEGPVQTLDLLAFSDPFKQDWQTTAIAAYLGRESAVGGAQSKDIAKQLFEATAAPTTITGNAAEGKADLWFSCHDGMRSVTGVNLTPEALTNVFGKNRADVQRERLAGLRSGQRHLFDHYLYARREELATFLQRGISKAVRIVGDASWGQDPAERRKRRSTFSKVALALLAARILEDKGALGSGSQATDARGLLLAANNRWDMFFKPVVDEYLPELKHIFGHRDVQAMLAEVHAHLRGPVHWGLVTHEMLADLYEKALAAERAAGSQQDLELKGIHYTPYGIAKQIMDRIPVEEIPAAERTVCDFACGSGSFLLAATDRLSDLLDPRESGASSGRLQYLREHVLGNDLDPVAGLVARLSYVLAYWSHAAPTLDDIPIPKMVEGADALQLDVTACFGTTPSVMVGNPPFGGRNPPGDFLERALHILKCDPSPSPRYLGMVMPAAFLVRGKTHKHALAVLRANARILELWELPERAVGLYAEHPTCVVIAEATRGAASRAGNARVCQTRSRRTDAIRAFRDRGVSSWSYVAEIASGVGGQTGHAEADLAFSPLQSIWNQLAGHGKTLSSICAAAWGFLHTQMHEKRSPEFSTKRGPGLVPFFRRQSALMPYQVTGEDWKASHGPGEGRYWKKGTGPVPCTANWPKYESAKIIVSARTHRNERQQLIAAVDMVGIYPAKDLLGIVLSDQWREAGRTGWDDPAFLRAPEATILRWLCAILNSPIGHAWVAAHAGPRGPRKEVFHSLPLPRGYDPEIARIVKRLEEMTRPKNLRVNPTWDPQSGILPSRGDLFDQEATKQEEAGNRYWRKVQEINERVLASYGLTEAQEKQIGVYLKSMTDPWADHPPGVADLSPVTKLRVLRGMTGPVDVSRQSIEMKLSWRSLGNGKAVEVPIPKFMPGWALEAGREFWCRAPDRCTLKDIQGDPWLLREFRPVPYGYLDTEALEKMIGFEAGGGSGEPS